MKKLSEKFGLKLSAIGIMVLLFSLTKLPNYTVDEKGYFEKEFAFQSSYLYEPKNLKPKSIRVVHPQYDKISAWISFVGASVAITDLDNNGYSNDIIHVDTRFDEVLISSAENTISTIKPFMCDSS